jgi:thiamine biosynthesis lipoprotein
MRNHLIIIGLLAVLMMTVFALRACTGQAEFAESTAFVMGTPVEIKVEGKSASQLAQGALEEIKRLDKLFNRYDPSSEVSRLNRGEKFVLSKDLKTVLALAEKIKNISNGAFDVCYQKRIDLGGIGKGYAVELTRRLLLKKGAKSGIINMRSSIAVFGPRSWEIGVQHPRKPKELLGTVELQDGQALATSGDYERGRHIIDPRTGQPAAACAGVTLIGKDAGELDALSTAVFVLGTLEGIRLLEQLGGVQGVVVDVMGKVWGTKGTKLIKINNDQLTMFN